MLLVLALVLVLLLPLDAFESRSSDTAARGTSDRSDGGVRVRGEDDERRSSERFAERPRRREGQRRGTLFTGERFAGIIRDAFSTVIVTSEPQSIESRMETEDMFGSEGTEGQGSKRAESALKP